MRKYALFFAAVIAFVFSGGAAWAQASRVRVLAFYVTDTEPDHVQFAQQALRYFAETASRDNFEFAATTDWSKLSDNSMRGIQLVIWLNGAPTKPEQRAAFEAYMKNGGAWLGFHFAGYNDESTHWPWFVDFMGGSVFYNNSWPPMPAKLLVDSPQHPVAADMPESYVAPNNEWYIWKPSPRLNKDVRVLLTLDPANYPIGLKGILTQGDLPVAWTNTKYKMVYVNMGHGDRIFSSPTQNRFIENATNWLLRPSSSVVPAPSGGDHVPEALATEISMHGIALNAANHKVYAVNTASDTVTVVDAVARTMKTVKVGSGPEALDVNPRTNTIYVANTGSANISVIDGNTDQVSATVSVGDFPYAIAVNPATNKIYVSKTFGHAMVIIDGKTNSTTSLKEGVLADLMTVNPSANKVYLVNYEDDNVVVVDGNTNAMTRVPAGNHVWGTTVDAESDRAYFSLTGASSISVIDGKTNTVTRAHTGDFPCAIAVDGKNGRVYVANYASDSITVIDPRNNAVLATVASVRHPQAIAIDPVHRRVYVASTVANEVAVLDENKNSVVSTLQVTNRPFASAVDSMTNTAFVAGLNGDNLMLIDGATLKVTRAAGLPKK